MGANVIEFLCPSGHRISCPADQAGRAAKCPRRGVRFRVPGADEAGTSESTGSDPDVSPAELSDSGVGGPSPSGSQPGGKERQIEFLCPNGHHLHGPASLQGRPGACPECGSRFRIPIMDEAEEEGEPEQLDIDDLDDSDGQETIAAEAEEADEALTESEDLDAGEYGMTFGYEPCAARRGWSGARAAPACAWSAGAASAFLARPSATIAMLHPLAEILVRLWAAKGESAKVELQLTGGETVSPDRFAKQLSRGSHGVFASKAADGTWERHGDSLGRRRTGRATRDEDPARRTGRLRACLPSPFGRRPRPCFARCPWCPGGEGLSGCEKNRPLLCC